MQNGIHRFVDKAQLAMSAIFAFLGQPWWSSMKLNAEQVAERRRNRESIGDHSFLRCGQNRSFW